MSETDIVPRQCHVETASATTDPDNANSGIFAYVLTAAVLVALAALLVGLSGVFGTLAAHELESLGYLGSDELNGLVEQYDGTGQGGSQGTSGQGTGELSCSEALDLALAPYTSTVDDGVMATDYAGVPDDVRSYVRAILSCDSDAQQQVALQLNAAAREDDPSSAMQAVVDAANSGKAVIENQTAEPTFSDQTLNDQLSAARQATLDRWDAIIAEVQLLDTTGDISASDLRKADGDVVDKTSDAAEDFTRALQTAAGE